MTHPFPFTSRQLAFTGADSLDEETVEDQTIITGNINTIVNVNPQCHCIKDRPISFH
jgi:hypothetical protein